jgi:F-type H+-transporting ATPase subunit epsilon
MHLTLVSIVKKFLDLPDIIWVSLPTRDGEITIFPNHEPLITALTPGILTVCIDNKNTQYAVGGGVAEITPTHVTIAADMVEDGTHLSIEDIRKKKAEVEELLKEYKNSNTSMDMDTYIELEQQLLKEAAREQLAMK